MVSCLKNRREKEELIIKKSQIKINATDCHLKLGGMKEEFRVIVDHKPQR